MTGTRIIVTTEDELRRLIREELEAQKVSVVVAPAADLTAYVAGRQPDGMGGFNPAEPTPSSAPQGGD